MRVSLEWLREYVDIEKTTEELADLLSMSGTAVERVITMGRGVSGIVVGRVVEVKPHPDADNLRIAMVEDGGLVRQVICGAPNLAVGMKTALALPGATLPAVSSKQLRRATIRGVESDGMLASAAELGISDDAAGIIELEGDSRPGMDIHEVLPVEDVILELEITPNRPDCMSMVGIAREVAALTGSGMRTPEVRLREIATPAAESIKVVIKDQRECPRYTARIVTGVEVGPSPYWMQRRLIAAGLRPINNLVDVTNYVMMELGQPLHAFDLELVGGATIVVRLARRGELLTTLDGIDRQLDSMSLVIADIEKPVALAGVMGGQDSEVTPNTRNVLIESAYFSPVSILRTSKRLGLRSEASARFERGTDYGGTAFAAMRAAELMNETAGGGVAAGDVDTYPEPIQPVTIIMRPPRVNKVLGTSISRAEMIEILEGLGAGVEDLETPALEVPSFRPDLEREIDLIEEIARVHGYDKIPESLPAGGGMDAGLTRRQRADSRVTEALVAEGLCEAVTTSFMRSQDLDSFMLQPGDDIFNAVTLMNPLAETGDAMRTTLLPGLLRVAAGNISKGNHDLGLFERGRVFFAKGPGELPVEVEMLGILMSGRRDETHWDEPPVETDFLDIKSTVENLAAALKVEALAFEPVEVPYLAPGIESRIVLGGVPLGLIGRLHPQVAGAFGIEADVYVAVLELERLIHASRPVAEYEPIGRFPSVKMDVALVVDEGVPSRALFDVIRESGGEFLREVRLFDVYRGPQLPPGKKSLAFALEFVSSERTLTDEEVMRELNRIIESLGSSCGGVLRGGEKGQGGCR